MAELLAGAGKTESGSFWDKALALPFPSLDALNEACSSLARTCDLTKAVENGFLGAKDSLKVVLDPLTQPLSWLLEGALWLFDATPWWLMIPLILLLVHFASKSIQLVGFVASALLFLSFIDHYSFAMETLSIIFVCATLCVILGVPIG
ncbi:glycine/betaine ABC transporter permease, partial [Escherichia coli]|nr:glycine/betaine ABC transporter permease [Escherichia coli]